MAAKFDITPEKEASFSQFLYRQFFVNPKAITRQDADLSGKVAILTGANGGIGLQCAYQLLDLSVSRLILAVRNESKATELLKALSLGRNPKPIIEVWHLDYMSYDSIVKFAERARNLDRLDIVILNAGIYRAAMHIVPSTGHEENIQVNYLSNVLLLTLLLPVLKAKAPGPEPGRLTMVSSDAAAWHPLKKKDEDPFLPSFDKKQTTFNHNERYGNSKLLGQLFIAELAKRIPASVAIVNCVNPGFCHSSGLGRDANGTLLGAFLSVAVRLVGKSPVIGARSIIDAVVKHGTESHGEYLEGGKLTPMGPFVYSEDAKKLMPRLWKETMNELALAGIEDIIEELSSR